MKKKLFIILLALITILVFLIYIFIPTKISVAAIRYTNCSLNSAERMILHINKWDTWWPKAAQYKNNSHTFIFKSNVFKPDRVSLNSVEVDIFHDNLLTRTELMVLPFNKDSVQIEWRSKETTASKNPVKRIKQYWQTSEIKDDIDFILNKLQSFLASNKNIYGMDINEVKVKDSTLISTKFTTSSLPGTAEIYSAINKLKKYIAQQKAKANNFPMMHVDKIDSSHYETMIAIPVNKQLPETENLKTKRMVLGNILEAEIKGGELTVQNAMQELESYRKDYGYQTPAIPFSLLVTDRSKEPDTIKWVTQIYYPVY